MSCGPDKVRGSRDGQDAPHRESPPGDSRGRLGFRATWCLAGFPGSFWLPGVSAKGSRAHLKHRITNAAVQIAPMAGKPGQSRVHLVALLTRVSTRTTGNDQAAKALEDCFGSSEPILPGWATRRWPPGQGHKPGRQETSGEKRREPGGRVVRTGTRRPRSPCPVPRPTA